MSASANSCRWANTPNSGGPYASKRAANKTSGTATSDPAHLSRRMSARARKSCLPANSSDSRVRFSINSGDMPRVSACGVFNWIDVTSRWPKAGYLSSTRRASFTMDGPLAHGLMSQCHPANPRAASCSTDSGTRTHCGVSRTLSMRQSMNVVTANRTRASVTQRTKPHATWNSRSRPRREASLERPIRGTIKAMLNH